MREKSLASISLGWPKKSIHTHTPKAARPPASHAREKEEESGRNSRPGGFARCGRQDSAGVGVGVGACCMYIVCVHMAYIHTAYIHMRVEWVIIVL